MYRIATNVCLREAERRARDVAGIEAFLSPYPDRLLDELSSAGPGPEAEAEQREGVALSFVASAQLLPPKQRAVLVLRDALGWSAREVADLLGDSVPAVNSALQRARDRLERARSTGELARRHVATADAVRPGLVGRFLEAWEAVDVPAIVALLADDALMTMPPQPMRVVGPRAIGEFFATVPAEGRLDLIRLVPTGANRQPALAAYVQDPAGGVFRAYGVMVLALDGDAIAGITGFAGYPDLVTELGLPAELDRDDAPCSPTLDENAERGTDA
jgi:RNA polymerase sigma-70 factor (ECF subfamily)